MSVCFSRLIIAQVTNLKDGLARYEMTRAPFELLQAAPLAAWSSSIANIARRII